MLFSLHLRVDYEHISLKNHRRKLEFFMQKGNTLINSAGTLRLEFNLSVTLLMECIGEVICFSTANGFSLFGIPKG